MRSQNPMKKIPQVLSPFFTSQKEILTETGEFEHFLKDFRKNSSNFPIFPVSLPSLQGCNFVDTCSFRMSRPALKNPWPNSLISGGFSWFTTVSDAAGECLKAQGSGSCGILQILWSIADLRIWSNPVRV